MTEEVGYEFLNSIIPVSENNESFSCYINPPVLPVVAFPKHFFDKPNMFLYVSIIIYIC